MKRIFATAIFATLALCAISPPPPLFAARNKKSTLKTRKPKPVVVEDDDQEDEEEGEEAEESTKPAAVVKPDEKKIPADAKPGTGTADTKPGTDIKPGTGTAETKPGIETKPTGTEVNPTLVIDPNRKQAKRRILILPLENVTQSKDHEWMRESLADNLKTQLVKSKKFDVLDAKTAKVLFPDIKTDGLTQADAATLAKRLNCEVVTLGRFTVRDHDFRLEMEGADALTGTAIGAEKADGKTDGTMFQTIDKVVETLAADLSSKLPVLYADELKRDEAVEKMLTQSQDATANSGTAKMLEPQLKYRANLLLSLGMPVSGIGDHIGMGFGGRASLARTTNIQWLMPIAMADAFATGAKTTDSMFFYFGGAGLSYAFDLPLKLKVYPHAVFGFSGGSLTTPVGSSSFMLPAFDVGGTFERALVGNWRLAASLSYRHIFDPFVTGSFVQAHIGVGYGF
ncbi:MAG: hypothetical protein JSR44_02125 [Spirochaetes bacterium]|nr:hypothetical protein [Spirochaetota bacterium]